MDRYQLGQVFSPRPSGNWQLRQGYVVSDDGGSVTVTIAGSDVPIPGVKYLGAAPSASAGCWLMVSEFDLFVLGQTS
jgi:hypothetical protein